MLFAASGLVSYTFVALGAFTVVGLVVFAVLKLAPWNREGD